MTGANARWTAICLAIVAAMLAIALNAAPLYAAFCRVTGFGGTTQTATNTAETRNWVASEDMAAVNRAAVR